MIDVLVRYSRIKQEIIEAKTWPELSRIVNVLEELHRASKREALEIDCQNEIAESKLRTQRRMGELLKLSKENGQRNGQGGDQKSNSHEGSLKVKLSDIGINFNKSSRLQQMASISESSFTERIEEVKGKQGKLSTGAVLMKKEARREENQAKVESAPTMKAAKFATIVIVQAATPYPIAAATRARVHQLFTSIFNRSFTHV